MRSLYVLAIAAVVLVGCGESKNYKKLETSKDDFINRFYAKYNIEEEYQISFEDLVEISKGEDDRSNISEGLKFFQREEYYEATITAQFFTPDDEPVPGPPPFSIRHKYVLGEYLVEEADFPTPNGGINKVMRILIQLGNTDEFLMYAFDDKIIQLALISKIGRNKFSTKEVGIQDNGEELTILGRGIIRKGFANVEFEISENGMVMIKQKVTYDAKAKKTEPKTAIAPDISIHNAAKNGNIEAVKQHLTAGTDANVKGGLGSFSTPLTVATMNGHSEIAKLLIAKGVDINAPDDGGWTPLHFAAWDGNKEITELLIAKGADVNAKNKDEETVLHVVGNGNKEIVELLIDKGVDVNTKDNLGRTPLDMFDDSVVGGPEIADLLRKHGGKTAEELKAEGK